MKTRKWPALSLVLLTLSLGSCSDWGESDPPAGNQVYPKLEQIAEYTFEDDPSIPVDFLLCAFDNGDVPYVEKDAEEGSNVLKLNGGYTRIYNPLNKTKVQNAVSMTFYVKQAAPVVDEETGTVTEPQDLSGALFSFANENHTQKMYFTANGMISFNGMEGEFEANNPNNAKTGLMKDAGVWHYVALSITNKGYSVYVDGEKRMEQNVTDFDMSKIVNFMNNAPFLYLGYGSDSQCRGWSIDNLKIYRNTLTEKETADPRKPASGGTEETVESVKPIYFNSFEGDAGDATIVGGGSIKNFGSRFGDVFSNAKGGTRSNYLLLPENILGQSASTQALTIGVWVNRGNETTSSDYTWSPLFTAYASAPSPANTFPMLACQYRGVLQVNCNGWSDYTDAQNVAGANTLYHNDLDWLADGGWHYYTATFTPTTAKVYIDGELKNEWVLDGSTNTAAGLFSNGADLKYICLGGNQAWDWGDPDPGFWFDDLVLFNVELNQGQIKQLINIKNSEVYYNSFGGGSRDATIKGAGTIKTVGGNFGDVFSNAKGGMRTNYLILPSDVLSHSSESQATTISVWVNRGNETTSSDYMWSPLFTAYGNETTTENTLPMLACQYRGVLQVNCNGWSDYTDTQNDAGANAIYHDATDWLADGEWHLYTATFTPTTAKVYFDGVLKNSWTIDGTTNTAAGLFSNGSDLNNICLGGNQAWTWGDPDPGFWFDDMTIYDKELTQTQIQQIYDLKK